MYPRAFEYRAPETLDEVLQLLAQYGEEARVLAGGQSLIPLLKLRVVSPTLVVDLGRISGLERVRVDGEQVELGPGVRHSAWDEAGELGRVLPWVAAAAGRIGDRQVRNLGTVAGALAEADPAGDWPAVALALGGEVVARSRRGQRSIPFVDLFVDPYTTSLAPDEVITAVRIKRRAHGCYVKVERRSGDFAIAGCAVCLSLGDAGEIRSAGVGLTGLGAAPVRAAPAERCLVGGSPSPERVAAARQAIRESIDPLSDTRGSAEYKRHLAGVVFERALRGALAEAAVGR